ncbi:MAG: RHS repeat protein, partial [Clostridia bacterium]|nr:RHS repeat protein [Clostridia bacterium]
MKKTLFLFVILSYMLVLHQTASASSTTSAAERLEYKNSLADRYGDLYAPAYSSDDVSTAVNVKNKSVETREVDYVLPGKNGMDIEFIRTHSTDTTDFIPLKTSSVTSSKVDIKLFTYSAYNSKNIKHYIKVHIPYDSSFLDPKYATMRTFWKKNILKWETTDGTKYASYKVYPSGDLLYTLEKGIAPETHKCIEAMKCSFEENSEGTTLNNETNWDYVYRPKIVWSYCDSYYEEFIGFFMNEHGEVFPISMPFKTVSGEGNLYQKPYFEIPVRYTADMHTEAYNDKLYRKDSIEHENGFWYGMTITDYDGKTYYFNIKASTNSTIFASAIGDRYGNFINYQEHTDTYGRSFLANDEGIFVDINGTLTQVVSYEASSITSPSDPYDFIDCDDTYYFTVKKLENPTDDLSLTKNVTRYEMSKGEVKVEGSDAMTTCYSQIDKITLPTGAKKYFTYSQEKVGKSFRLDKRANVLSEKDEENSTIKNEINYTYSTGKATAENISTGELTEYSIDTKYHRFNQIIEDKYFYSIYTSYTYNSNDPGAWPKSVGYKNGVSNTTNYEYTNFGQITSAQDSFTNQTYTYGKNGLITKSEYMRDDTHKIRTVNTLTEDEKSIASSSIYEINTETGEEVLEETSYFTYDESGNITSVTKNDGARDITAYSTYTYNSDGSYYIQSKVEDVDNADGENSGDVITYTYYDALGRCVKTVDANGGETETEYDILNRPVRITNPDGTVKTISYNTAQNIVTETKENGLLTKYEYTPLGKLKRISVSENGSSWRILCLKTYDNCNRVSSETYYQDYSGTTPVDYLKSDYTYNVDGTPSKIVLTDKQGNTLKEIIYSYRKGVTLSQAHNAEVSGKDYNWVMQTIKGDDAVAPYSVKTYTDIRGLTYKQEIVDGSGSIKYQDTYLYDRAGNLLEKKNGRAWSENWEEGYTERYEYDYANRAVKAYNALGDYIQTSYNALGLPVSQTDYAGNAALFEYDKLGRQIKMTEPIDDSRSAVSKTYYDKKGNVIKSAMQKDNGSWITEENTYDEMNRLLYTRNGDNAYVQYFYDEAGNVTDKVTGADFLVTADELARDDSFSLTSYT